METRRDGDLEIVMAGPTGYGNNVFVVIDRSTGEAAFIDAPGEPDVNAAAADAAGVKKFNWCGLSMGGTLTTRPRSMR